MQIRSIGIDLGKTTFHLIALGDRFQVVTRKKLSRSQLLEYTANLPSSLIGMEAGVGSHFLGRCRRAQSGTASRTGAAAELALFYECLQRCARKLLDTADIVRDRDISTARVQHRLGEAAHAP